jgi:catechol 2,3-dioxygenase-like lactoylglutathione lyase family enzyme
VPGSWMYVGPAGGPTTQIHIMGSDGPSGIARSEQQDPTRFHVAFAVDDIEAARQELDRTNTAYWVFGGVVGPNSVQIFLEDPAGNMIELHQIGTCNCNRIALTPEGSTA